MVHAATIIWVRAQVFDAMNWPRGPSVPHLVILGSKSGRGHHYTIAHTSRHHDPRLRHPVPPATAAPCPARDCGALSRPRLRRTVPRLRSARGDHKQKARKRTPMQTLWPVEPKHRKRGDVINYCKAFAKRACETHTTTKTTNNPTRSEEDRKRRARKRAMVRPMQGQRRRLGPTQNPSSKRQTRL